MDISISSGWALEQMQRFEEALRVHDSDPTPNRWHHIALAVGGGKSTDDVRRYYELLDREANCIEAAVGVGGKSKGNCP